MFFGLSALFPYCCYCLDNKQFIHVLGLQWNRRVPENLSLHELEDQMASQDFRRQLAGYGLTTAHIYYRRPDHPWLLQSYVWQEYDLCPKFPELQRFLDFWRKSLDGALHSVMVAHSGLIKPAELRAVEGVFRLH